VEDGILERVRYSERPERFEYRLTRKGRELNLALTARRHVKAIHSGVSDSPRTIGPCPITIA
jgi:DNA-binding HxlR family transcriptional regulator